MRLLLVSAGLIAGCAAQGQAPPRVLASGKPFVNQAGYNLGEAKRFVCPGAADGTKFRIMEGGKTVYSGSISGYAGEFTPFDPAGSTAQYVIEVEGFGRSVPFGIGDHLMERVSSRLAYQFFIYARGGLRPSLSPANVIGGGPSRDGGARV